MPPEYRQKESVGFPTSEQPVYVAANGILCRLHVWTEPEWKGLPEAHRPIRCEFHPDLGWVGLVPEPTLNN